MADIYEPSDNYVGKDTVCPLMSVERIVWDGHIVHCFGEYCQWWHFCNLNTLAEIKSSTQAIKAIMRSILEATEDGQTRDVADFDSRK